MWLVFDPLADNRHEKEVELEDGALSLIRDYLVDALERERMKTGNEDVMKPSVLLSLESILEGVEHSIDVIDTQKTLESARHRLKNLEKGETYKHSHLHELKD